MWNKNVKLNGIGPVVKKEMSFKDISYPEFCQPVCSIDRNTL